MYFETSFHLPSRTARFPSCMKKIGSLRPSGLPENAGTRLTPCIGIVVLPCRLAGYFAPVTVATVGMMSIRCAGCLSNLPLRCFGIRRASARSAESKPRPRA